MKLFSRLDKAPILGLVAAALLFGLAPFQPQPHLVEKAQMLLAGELTRALDIFDVVFHLSPTILFAIRLLRQLRQRKDVS